jgi:hypothetical protein
MSIVKNTGAIWRSIGQVYRRWRGEDDGCGLLTGHPIGLFIVLGILFMGLVGIPEARPFFVASAALGTLWGLVLWLRHR